ncbi:hypothetical protein QCA50_006585 [Cerrena zonata]|uniref:CHAT domain-containing protein n=1 Tax=Cerrena zonata TaxID=2478898 RepID=A0AAW0GFJ5_9APHY
MPAVTRGGSDMSLFNPAKLLHSLGQYLTEYFDRRFRPSAIAGSFYTLRVYMTRHWWFWFWIPRPWRHLEQQELDSSILWSRRAVDFTPIDTSHGIERRGLLVWLLRYRFSRSLQRDDIDEAVNLWRGVIESLDQPESPGYPCVDGYVFYMMSSCLYFRYHHYGNADDLYSAIQYARQAIDSNKSPKTDPRYPSFLEHFAYCLSARSLATNNYQDHLDAVSLMHRVLGLSPFQANFLITYAITLRSRVDFRNSLSENVLCALYNGMELDNSPENRSVWLAELGRTYYVRRREGDLERAAALLHQAESLADVQDRVHRAKTLLTLAEVEAQRQGLSEALELVSKARVLLPPGHTLQMEGVARAVSNILVNGRMRLKFGNTTVDGCIEALAEAARSPSTAPDVRYRSALLWATICEQQSRTDAIEAFITALDILPRLVWVGLYNDLRLQLLATQGLGLASTAAATVIRYYPEFKLETAVEMLEVGRSIFWTHSLQLRSPFDELLQSEPELARELVQVSKEMEAGSLYLPDSRDEERLSASALGISGRNHFLSDRWDQLVGRAREIPGFEDFLRPRSFSQLSEAARNGVVIIVNVSPSFCDALIIRSSSRTLEYFTLPITETEVTQLANKWKSVLKRLGRSYRSSRGGTSQLLTRAIRKRLPSKEDPAQEVLSSLWTKVVEPILDALHSSLGNADSLKEMNPNVPLPSDHTKTLQYPKLNGMRQKRVESALRLWWCPTGRLTSLPLHAAGNYNAPGQPCLMDVAVSSYTPTLSVLLNNNTRPVESPELLAVAQRNAPNLPLLPNAEKELKELQKLAAPVLTVNSLTENTADIENVAAGIVKCNWLHLACHGLQSGPTALDSSFALHDGKLKLSRIIQISSRHAEFAYLSACETAQGDEAVPDEGMHLAGGLLFAGFPSVIATAWSIDDEDGPVIAKMVYEHLFRNGRPDTSEAALALHMAVNKLREQGVSVMRWAPFIHVGR